MLRELIFKDNSKININNNYISNYNIKTKIRIDLKISI